MTVRRKKKGLWVIGIDPSLTGFGVVMLREQQVYSFCYASKHKGVERLIDIWEWLEKTIENVTAFDVGEICMEGYAPNAKWNREAMGELCGAVKIALVRILPDPVCYPTIVPPASLKKYVTGKGNAPKDQMMLSVYKKWGFDAPSNDEADAYALARLAACMLGTDRPQSLYEEAVAQGLNRWTERPHN